MRNCLPGWGWIKGDTLKWAPTAVLTAFALYALKSNNTLLTKSAIVVGLVTNIVEVLINRLASSEYRKNNNHGDPNFLADDREIVGDTVFAGFFSLMSTAVLCGVNLKNKPDSDITFATSCLQFVVLASMNTLNVNTLKELIKVRFFTHASSEPTSNSQAAITPAITPDNR